MPDGSPQVSIIWIDSDRNHLIINTAEERAKTNNMRRDRRIALTIVNAENPYQQVKIRGRVVEITHKGADKRIDSLAKKYLGVDKYPHRTPGKQRVIARIIPDHVSTTGDEEPA